MNLEPVRAARLLVLATRLAKPRTLGFNEDQPRDEDGRWVAGAAESYPKLALSERDVRNTTMPRDKVYRGETVGGLRVRTHIPNTSSVESTYNENEYESLPGIRSVPLDDLGLEDYRSKDDNERVQQLAEQIKESGEINPLIVVRDSEGSYVLEGNHRARALKKAGKTHAPALVIVEYPKRALAGRIEGPLHKVADSHAAKLSVAIRYAFASARAAMRRELHTTDDVKRVTVLGIVTLRQELKEVLPKILKKMYLEGGQVGGDLLSNQLRTAEEFRAAKRESPSTKLGFKFDVTDERAVEWADKHAASLIDGISETSREDINNAVAEFLETGDFKELRDEILAAVGDVARAERIARNEPMVAVHEGQRAAWNQAVEEGLLPEDAVREWIVVGDDKVCPICEALEGKTAILGEEYEEGIEGPPAHVMCRCSESISSFKSLGGPGSGNFGHAGRPGEVGGSSSDGSPEANSPEDAKRIIEEEQRKYLTPEEYDRLPPGIRAWKTRTRKEKAEGKEPPPKPEVKKEEPKKEDKPIPPTGVIATKEREEAIEKRTKEIYEASKGQGGGPDAYSRARVEATKEDAEKNGPLPPNALSVRREALYERHNQLLREARDRNNELAREGKPTVKIESEKLYRQAQEEDAQKWGPYAHPEEVEAIRKSDQKWSPSQQLIEVWQPATKIEREVIAPEHQSAKQIQVRGVADEVARSMNFDPALIAVRDRGNSPRTFELNGKKLTEGGHYNPQTGRIEVNANYGVDRGLIVHEIQHAQWDYVNSQAKEEQAALRTRWSREQAADFDGTRYFLKNGKVQAKYRDEFEKQLPHTSVLARAGLGNHELGIKADIEGMKRDDGVSNYSKEYWTKAESERGFDAKRGTTNYIGELAVNETLSEVSRRSRGSVEFSDSNYQMAPRFVKLNKDVEALYSKDLRKVQRFFARKKAL